MTNQSSKLTEEGQKAHDLMMENIRLRALLERVLDFSQRIAASPKGGQKLIKDISTALKPTQPQASAASRK